MGIAVPGPERSRPVGADLRNSGLASGVTVLPRVPPPSCRGSRSSAAGELELPNCGRQCASRAVPGLPPAPLWERTLARHVEKRKMPVQEEAAMVGPPEGTPIDHEGRPAMPVPKDVDDPHWKLEQVAPLIHELIAWDLVCRTGPGTFVLRDDVQERLEEFSIRQSRTTTQVYVGRPCERCGAIRITRIVGGVRVCTTCSASKDASQGLVPSRTSSPERARRDHRPRWHRRAS